MGNRCKLMGLAVLITIISDQGPFIGFKKASNIVFYILGITESMKGWLISSELYGSFDGRSVQKVESGKFKAIL